MSVIIRLQGLPWSASAMDIRNFFKGLSVPPGGVHIIGGEKGDAFIAFSSDEDARQAMMLNMGYIGDGQIFLFLSSKAEMQRTIEEAKLHSSASGGSIASSTQPPAQPAVSVSQPQQLQLQQQQDPYLGTRYPHTSEPEGQGYMGRGPERPIVGAQDTGLYGQQLSGVQTYGGQTKPSAPNEYGSRTLPPREVYDNHVVGSRGADPTPHPNHGKAFGVASQFITQRDGYAGQEPYPFSVQDLKDRKSYPPTSRPTHDVNFRDPRQARPDVNPPVSQQHWERGDSIAPYHDSDPQRIDQGRGPPLRPVYPGNAPDLDAGRPPRREPWEGSMPPGHEHLYSGQNEISRGRIDRGNLMPGHVQGAFLQHSKLEGPQPPRGIDGRMDAHSQNRPDVPALGRSDIPTQRQDIPPHAAGPDVPQFRRMDGVPPNRTDYPPSGPVGGPPPNRPDVYGRPEGPPLAARDSPQHGRPDVPPYSRPGAPPYGHPDERFGGPTPARNDRPQYASPADGMHRDRFDGPPSKMPDQFGVRDIGLPPAGRGRPDQHDMMSGRHTDRPDVTKGGRPDFSVPDRPDIPLRGPPGFPRPDGRPDGLPHPHPEVHPLFGRGDPRHIDGSGPRPRPGEVHHGLSNMTSPAGRPSDLPERQQDDPRFRDANPNSTYGGPPRSFEEAKGFVADFDRRRPPVQGPAGEIPSAQQKHVPPPNVSSANNAPDAAKAEVRERESDTDARSSSQRSSREPDTSVPGRRSRDRDRSRSRERDRTRDRDRDRDKDRSRDKERDRDKDRDRKSRDRERDRDRRDRDRDRTRHSRDRDRDRDRDRREKDRKSKDDDHDRDRRSSRSRDDKDKSERSEADRKQAESNEPKNSALSKDVMPSKPPAVSPATVKPAVPDEKKGPNASPAARPENNKKSQLGLLGPAPEGFPVMFPDVNPKNKTPVTARGTPGAVHMPIGQPKIVPPTPSIASVAQEGGSVSNNLGMAGHGNMPQGGRNLKNDSKNIDNIPIRKNKAAAFPGEREPIGLHNDKSRREERDIMHPRDLEASIPKGNEGNFPISDAFENRKPSFPAEWVPGPGRSPGMGMGFRERSPHIRLPRTSGPPSLLDWRGPSDRFPSPDVRPNLGQVNEFGKPVGTRSLGPVDPRGTKRPHPDESGQAPPLTVIAKGMPTTISYRDVRRLFGNCEIPRDGLKLINDSKGDRIGVALVKFITSEGYYKALDKNGSLLNNHAVEVYPCPRQEFENAIDSYVPKKDFSDDFNKPSPADDVNLRIAQLNGLPREVTVEDIQKFFQGIKIANNGFCVYIEFDQAGSASGNAFVEFETQDDFKNALKNDCKTIGFRPIHVSAGSYKDIQALVNRQQEMWKDNPDMLKKHRIPNGKAKDVNIGQCFCIQIKHVPPFATGRDVRDLLSGLEIAPRGLQICHDAFGRPTGDAFVEFASAETASRALERRGQKIGPYDVDISLITKAEMIEKLRKARSIELLEPKKQHCFVKAENLPFNVTVGEILNFFRGYDPIPETIRLNVDNATPSQGKSAALIGFPTKEDADEAIRGVDGNIVRANKITLRHDNAE